MKMKRFAGWFAAISILAWPVLLPAAETGQEGMPGMPGGHGGMKMDDHGKMGDHGKMMHDGHGMRSGELLFSGKVGPWMMEARLIEKQAYMEQTGVPAKIAARFAGERHLMMFLTDPTTGKTVSGAEGKVVITGPDQASSSKATLVAMGAHIGADVRFPRPGVYTFAAEFESGDKKGNATFTHTMK